MISPHAQTVETYLEVVFGYLDGLIPLRSFPEKKGAEGKPHNVWIKVNNAALEKILTQTQWAAKQGFSSYLIPGVVKGRGQAKAADITQMQVLLVDLDSGDTDKRLEELTKYLGRPTLIINSGGKTEAGASKLHLYWKLSEAAENESLKKLITFRHQLALKCGGDLHFQSAHQPIRIAGSVYHKLDQPKLVEIAEYNDSEYHLDELAEAIGAMPWLVKKKENLTLGSNKPSISDVLTTPVREGEKDQWSRFKGISSAIGYWVRRHHDGLVTDETMWQEIHDYNQVCVRPPKEEKWLKEEAKRLWNKHVKEHGEAKQRPEASLDYFTAGDLIDAPITIPEDIISPRILTPGGMWLLAGPPKIGKSDFLLNLFTYAAAGVDFLWFKFPRPLRIFYVQAEVEKPYLYERYMNVVKADMSLFEKGRNNLVITSKFNFQFDEAGLKETIDSVKTAFPKEAVDIIAIDPFRNIYQSGLTAKGDINEELMAFFRERLEMMLKETNPNGGMLIVHHTNKITAKMLEDDPFSAVSGGGALLSYPVSLTVLGKSDDHDNPAISAWFDIRNGPPIEQKLIKKNSDNRWVEENPLNQRVVRREYGDKLDAERARRIDLIIETLCSEALKGKFYIIKQFAEKFHNKRKHGSRRTIYEDCSIAATQRLIQFFNNPKDYGVEASSSGFGFMCTENMRMRFDKIDEETGEISDQYRVIKPTHFKHDCDGKKTPIEGAILWPLIDQKSEFQDALPV